MAKLEFDDEGSRLVEEFNASTGATTRRARILKALALKPGDRVLDVGCGPGHQVYEMVSTAKGKVTVVGVDCAESAISIARQRCSGLENVKFQLGDATNLPLDGSSFDAVMSSQVFEYLGNVGAGLDQIFRVLKPGGRVLIHDTDWGALLWHSSDPKRMAQVMKSFEGHLVDPHLPQTLGRKLAAAGFKNVHAEPFVQVETKYAPGSVSAIFVQFIVPYIVSQQGIPQHVADAWAADLRTLGRSYFFSSNEYIFTAEK